MKRKKSVKWRGGESNTRPGQSIIKFNKVGIKNILINFKYQHGQFPELSVVLSAREWVVFVSIKHYWLSDIDYGHAGPQGRKDVCLPWQGFITI